ncbi:cell filamentation protein Fic [Solemya pervernicosa gill symbiont]|uniref:Protein adenylyltransferase n=1 Tax=Solemya pervernicosa gill symbiont TaxID=642797 RepID=A0A1T2L2R7_9GAMM|nr:Fic/DOC family N-terminal domain-containing protein [Solemya pervernicosa gill symbiont]OOZ39371.1 cell filamentation protein Fic [Solemya pervernicosa gill symbiont]
MQPYQPELLPISELDKAVLFTVAGEANAALARYDGLLMGVVNPAVMLSPLTNQEAVLSSKIEGTQATVEEVLEHEAGQVYDEAKRDDIQEILNYRKALMLAKESVAERQIRLSLIRDLHAILMSSVRGANKEPGEFRKSQNWIGPEGCKIEEATFVPPSPLQLLDHLEAWEHYLDSDDIDPIVQTAIVHAQFELIHPFKDGNGRIGRLLIPLFLFSKRRLANPMFYLSAYLEAHRDEYYARLRAISQQQDWTGWCAFFLRAVTAQAQQNGDILREIMGLYEVTKLQVREITHSPHSAQLVDALFDRPIFTAADIARRADVPKPTVHKLIKSLLDEGLLDTVRKAAGRRPAILTFAELLNTLERKQLV